MPELPEVEVTRLSFADRIAGAQRVGAQSGQAPALAAGLCDPMRPGRAHRAGVRRRGKYLLVDLDQGLLLMHLGMSGSLSFAGRPAAGGCA